MIAPLSARVEPCLEVGSCAGGTENSPKRGAAGRTGGHAARFAPAAAATCCVTPPAAAPHLPLPPEPPAAPSLCPHTVLGLVEWEVAPGWWGLKLTHPWAPSRKKTQDRQAGPVGTACDP